ncbi:translation initiation factor 2 [Actinoplanes sp. DH11]|uniref:translation initiation factor 2 n=1 Tax=Actinoplanes sp. DH11 TaxID=2857011 RepID=UPI0027B89419|nr:translation initiation factor 2 [Actinoplanes sp. DH11]
MTSPTSEPDDAYWQRPDPAAEPLGRPEPDEPQQRAEPPYPGPPRTDPPAPHWRPPTIAHPPPPRALPGQDIDALDEAEGSARTVTYGIGLVAGAVAIILMCLLCARVFF